ncbi:hypothetical protein BC567DRAFT_227254 [Phyllosticta citribraziliensis]
MLSWQGLGPSHRHQPRGPRKSVWWVCLVSCFFEVTLTSQTSISSSFWYPSMFPPTRTEPDSGLMLVFMVPSVFRMDVLTVVKPRTEVRCSGDLESRLVGPELALDRLNVEEARWSWWSVLVLAELDVELKSWVDQDAGDGRGCSG